MARALPARRFDAGEKVSDPAAPAESNQPEQTSEEELNHRGENAALHQLPEAGYEKAANGGKDVAG
jgi:hypothetical protein